MSFTQTNSQVFLAAVWPVGLSPATPPVWGRAELHKERTAALGCWGWPPETISPDAAANRLGCLGGSGRDDSVAKTNAGTYALPGGIANGAPEGAHRGEAQDEPTEPTVLSLPPVSRMVIRATVRSRPGRLGLIVPDCLVDEDGG